MLVLELKERPTEIVRVLYGNIYRNHTHIRALSPSGFFQEEAISVSPILKNVLQCDALNADTVYFEYKEQDGDEWTRTLPAAWKRRPLSLNEKTNIFSISVDDGNGISEEALLKTNGYYRCVAELYSGESKAQSATLRIFAPGKQFQNREFIKMAG